MEVQYCMVEVLFYITSGTGYGYGWLFRWSLRDWRWDVDPPHGAAQ